MKRFFNLRNFLAIWASRIVTQEENLTKIKASNLPKRQKIEIFQLEMKSVVMKN